MTEISNVEHESKQINNRSRISRRDFLMGAGGVVAGVAGFGALQKIQKQVETIGSNPEHLNELLNNGLSSEWRAVSLYAGLVVASPGTRFYKKPTLEDPVEVQGLSGSARLIQQRPFFVASTLNLQDKALRGVDKSAVRNTLVEPGTLAFWLPGDSQLTFCSLARDIESLQTISRAPTTYEAESGLAVPATNIVLDGHKQIGGVPYAFIDDSYESRSYEWPDDCESYGPECQPIVTSEPVERLRLCGVSALYESATEVERALRLFSGGGYRHDLINMPGSEEG